MSFVNIYIFLAMLAGLLLAIQVGVNATVAKTMESNFAAVLISFSVGTCALLVYAISSKQQVISSVTNLQSGPWWVWTGGLLGAGYMGLAILSAMEIGAAQLVAFVVTGQLITSLILDHFGLFGFQVNQINIYKILGVCCLILGVILIRKF